MHNVTLHAFNWRYSEIIDKLDAIRSAGYGAILIPPPVYTEPTGAPWWQRYQPKDYRILLSYLGGKRDLERLIAACHSGLPKLQVYADLVINHMANEDRPDRFNFPGEAELARYRQHPALYEENRLYGDLSHGLFSPWDFNHAGEIDPHEWSDRNSVQFQNLSGLPDLKDADWVLEQQRNLVSALIEMGFDGFRIDAIKHITERMIDNIADPAQSRDRFWFGEVLTGSDRDEDIFLDPFLRETWISAYDFPLFQTIREAFRFGGSLRLLADPQSQGNALPWNRAVTFVVNHDIPHNDGFRFWLLDPQDEHLAYAYILGRDGGVPLIYSDHNESHHPEDRDRWFEIYKRPDLVAMIHFHNAVHGQPMQVLAVNDVVLVFRRGDRGIVAINKSGTQQEVSFNTWGLTNPGQYHDLIHPQELQLSGHHCTLAIPARTAQMWLLR
ncbi:alpha-amylase family glycosyl hydrolase [Lyngbya confervoides]|uniref:Alpha-amylase n=1 Tax=Lyngbya confervoides BDU141951 TaxID=1574623 RepID=A0ABD4T5B3_9CYAN|nr:alpha-amylase family glycosyl hydrolase [Lyngbya confervoides]MCM1983897.1 alpha-amylase family glycosyl hydrolase [Lyngbya confervoides BDU141951]